MHKAVIGRSREVCGPDALELVFAAALVLLVTSIAMAYGLHQIRMAKATEAFTLTANARIADVEYQAFHGEWPPPDDRFVIGSYTQGEYVKSLTLGRDGTLTAGIRLQVSDPERDFIVFSRFWESKPVDGYLSFRPVVAGAEGYGSVLFLCGFASPPHGIAEPAGANMTSLGGNDLPPGCRRGEQ